jgi:ABC-type sugar transport system substrate-binding protein
MLFVKSVVLRRLFAGVVACVLALAVSSCSSNSSSGSSGSADAGKFKLDGVKGKTIYYVGVSGNPWATVYNKVIMDTLAEQGAKVTHLEDPYDPQVQVKNLDQAVAAKPYAIMLLGLDYRALTPGLIRAQRAGIPVINMNSPPAPADKYMALSVETGNKELGTFAAQTLIDGLAAQGKTSGNVIAVTGTAGTEMVKQRMDAFNAELAKVPGIKLVAVEDGNWDQATSQKVASQLFAKYAADGGVQAAFGMADNQAIGIIQAAKQAGVKIGGPDGVVVTGSNCYQSGLEAIKAGQMYGTGSQSPESEATYTVEQALKFLKGEKLPAKLSVPEDRITADNVQDAIDRKICP